MKLSEVIQIWGELHIKDTGEIGYCDLDNAISKVCGVEDDILPCGGPDMLPECEKVVGG